MSYGIVIPNRFTDVIRPLVDSIKKFEPNTRVIIVADNHTCSHGFEIITHGMEHFQFSKAVNLGIQKLEGSDVILLNDDCVLLEPTFNQLAEMSNRYLTVGLISPLIKGCVGNPVQRFHEYKKWWNDFENIKLVWGKEPVCFPCVYLKRSMIDKIGMLDETITGYGFDDNEYCMRARREGWETAVTSKIVVQHGDGGISLGEGRGKSWSVSFARRYPHGVPKSS
jgi:GT2 family glycosyltransferase